MIWDRVFELAWESLRAQSYPVGAVLVDPAGEITHSGRNRAAEQSAPPGRLFGTTIAHAELDVLGQLPQAEYDGHTLYSSLQPCLMCLTALRLVGISQVVHAGADPLWNATDDVPAVLPELIAGQWPRRTGPADGFAGSWGSLLPAMWLVAYDPESAAEPSDLMPWATIERARRCVAGGVLECASAKEAYQLAASLSRSD
ncbi:tRNA(Arg) A34 adenosine deaminase TadA [Kribbella voronezhensis]|uniref:tRNA(Arg) A34 adenosine deaminase TadA n=1 Tax=Kribbella voronezhensis TaxID=2512212 RepID=A0A4R7STD6_9ACTN|nr:nucleoside deaminase [Kribbella voronezhensis]TDU82451.1 tRNA(Arg) A34 adenosine deaminase TadA [Kribbella voronezhensis]